MAGMRHTDFDRYVLWAGAWHKAVSCLSGSAASALLMADLSGKRRGRRLIWQN
ncbi:MAG: hypothetical protein HFH82_06490 [Lachnospiraceae bacterium]|nr:hypothetical protein [Lachnospiraceae bacterium]